MGSNDQQLGMSEEELIEKYIKPYISPPRIGESLGILDDSRDIIPRGPKITLSIDGGSINGLKLPWRTYSDVGWSAVTGVVSDHIVKGSHPYAILVSLGIDRDEPSILGQLYKGVGEAAEEYGVRILGGDLNSSNDPWITVAAIGFTSAKKLPGRCGARPGDDIVITGRYGAMGVVALDGPEKASRQKWVLEATGRPKVNIGLAGIIARYYRWITASMDVSDGLGFTLGEVSRCSHVTSILDKKPAYYHELEDYCGDEKCIWERILNGGEEYGAVLYVKHEMTERLAGELRNQHIPFEIVGRTVEGEGTVMVSGGWKPVIGRWDQFAGWKVGR